MKRTVPDKVSFPKGIVKYFAAEIKKKLPKEIAVIEVALAKSRQLNRSYQGKDKATNVLSFLYDKEHGEIIICPSVVRREARIQNHSFQYQMTWMIVHGMIHLAGMHHEKSEAIAEKVQKLERRILEKVFDLNSRKSQDTRIKNQAGTKKKTIHTVLNS